MSLRVEPWGRRLEDLPMNLADPSPTFSSWLYIVHSCLHPHPCTASCPWSRLALSSCLHLSCSPRITEAQHYFHPHPPTHRTSCPAGAEAATHMLRGAQVWWPPALDGASVPLGGSRLWGSLLGEQVGSGGSGAGVGDGHGHRDGGEWARGLRS